MGKKSVVANTMLLGTITIILSSAINLLIVPFITNRLGVEAYGFVTLGRNIADYAGIAMLALNSFSARFMSVSYMKNEAKEFSEYYSTVFISDIIIGAVLLLVGLVFSIFANRLLNIPVELATEVPILFTLIFFSSYLMFSTAVFQSVTYAIKRLDLYNLIRVIGLLVQAFILIILFFYSKGKIWYVGIAYLGQYLTIFVLCYYVKQKYLRNLRAKSKHFSFDKIKELISNGIWNSINQIGNVLNSGLDLLVTNLFLTAEIMGVISITKTISGLFSTLNQTVSQAFQPNFLQLFSENREEELLQEFKRATKLCGLIANTIFVIFITFGKDFYRLWVPTIDNEKIYILTILAIVPTLFEGYVSPLGYIYTLKMKNRIPCLVTIMGGILNVGGMVVLLRTTSFGEYAVLGTTTVIMTIIYLGFSPVYMSRCLKIRSSYFYPSIIQNILMAIISCVLTMGGKKFFPQINGWIGLIVLGGCFTLALLLFQMMVMVGKSTTTTIIRKLIRRGDE